VQVRPAARSNVVRLREPGEKAEKKGSRP